MSINEPTKINGIDLPKCCRNCDFFYHPKEAAQAVCRAMPPRIVVVYTKQKQADGTELDVGSGHAVQPPVEPSGLCGKWEARGGPVVEETVTVFMDPPQINTVVQPLT